MKSSPRRASAALLTGGEFTRIDRNHDHQALTSDYLETLLAQSSSKCGVVPVVGDLFQPLCAVYPRAAAATARAYLSLADELLQGLLRKLIAAKIMRALALSPKDKTLFRNLNSAAD